MIPKIVDVSLVRSIPLVMCLPVVTSFLFPFELHWRRQIHWSLWSPSSQDLKEAFNQFERTSLCVWVCCLLQPRAVHLELFCLIKSFQFRLTRITVSFFPWWRRFCVSPAYNTLLKTRVCLFRVHISFGRLAEQLIANTSYFRVVYGRKPLWIPDSDQNLGIVIAFLCCYND